MAIVVTIQVASSSAVIDAGYSHIRVFRSSYQDGTFLEISDISTRPVLDTNISYYNFEDSTGTSSQFYKTSYYNPSTLIESSLSTATKGIEVEEDYANPTYPSEISLTSSDSYDIDRVRYYIGDMKSIKRDYVSESCSNSYDRISSDGYTYEFENKGWPTSVIKDGIEFTSLGNPVVTDYNFITFSGTTPISTVSGVLDIWAESFRWSDREILKVFNTTPNPQYVSTASVTDEMLRISAAATIIQAEIAKLMGETSGSFELVGELKFNPDPLLKHKKALLNDLKEKLDELVDEAVTGEITGVRVE